MPDFFTRHGNLLEGTRKIEVGAHQPSVTDGGYGYNTPWVRVHFGSEWVEEEGSRIYARAISDHIWFKTVGAGVSPSGGTPDITKTFLRVPLSMAPTRGVRRQISGRWYRVQVSGRVLIAQVPSAYPVKVSGEAWPLG